MTRIKRAVQPARAPVDEGRRRWLLLVHQLLTRPSNLRVRTWRRLQQLGAVARRFIDPQARFGFVADRDAASRDAIPFDMFGVEFTHQADRCTFEALCSVFDIDDAGIRRLAAIVHDLDLKDGRFGAPEAASIGMVIEGLQLVYGADDDALLEHGIVLFESLYRAAERSTRTLGPRVVAPKRSTRARSSKTTSK